MNFRTVYKISGISGQCSGQPQVCGIFYTLRHHFIGHFSSQTNRLFS